jgi:RHH-type transcriptional regulator, rel operon repressor / antitoxin RelB
MSKDIRMNKMYADVVRRHRSRARKYLRCGKLDKLAAATRRSRSFLAAEPIREYVALNSWQIEEIQKGLAEAERGQFESESEVKRVAKKWASVRVRWRRAYSTRKM